MAFQPRSVGARLALRYVGFVVLGLVTFVFALQLTFPYDRVKDKLVEALSDKYEVTIGGVERGFMPGRMYFNDVTLRTRPTKSDEIVTTFFIEKLEVDLGILALLRGSRAGQHRRQDRAATRRRRQHRAPQGQVRDLEGFDRDRLSRASIFRPEACRCARRSACRCRARSSSRST